MVKMARFKLLLLRLYINRETFKQSHGRKEEEEGRKMWYRR